MQVQPRALRGGNLEAFEPSMRGKFKQIFATLINRKKPLNMTEIITGAKTSPKTFFEFLEWARYLNIIQVGVARGKKRAIHSYCLNKDGIAYVRKLNDLSDFANELVQRNADNSGEPANGQTRQETGAKGIGLGVSQQDETI